MAKVRRTRGPHKGCCTPVPDVRFVNSEVVSVHMHHKGPDCGGYMDPYPLEEWWTEVDSRAGNGSPV
jgi:hypothetical protein